MKAVSACVVAFGQLVLLSGSLASTDVFNSVLGSTSSCHRSCEMTYTLHTNPSEDELYACQRGCRLFSICQFVHETDDLNETKSECESTCREAYGQTDELFACNLGCQNQLPFAQKRNEQLEAMLPRIHLLYPLNLVKGIWGEIVLIPAPPLRFITPIYKDNQASFIERDRDLTGDDSSYEEFNLFGCLSRSSWLPGWILTTTLILSVLVLIWICCATAATAVDQYVPAEKLSIYGDREYMNEQKLIPYPASSLLIITAQDTEEEAGPLPTKVDLGKSNI